MENVLPIDKNTYYIALNKSSNAGYLAIITLFIGMFYIIIIYLFSFIHVPINTISAESTMVSSFLFSPDSTIGAFKSFVKSKCAKSFSNMESFSNISENATEQFIGKLSTTIQYWFHRLLLIFYIKKNTISSTQKMNRVSFMDIKI